MGRAPCCDKANVKKGPWSPEEDSKLKDYIEKYGTGGNWIALPQKAGLKRCGKSCRLRWLNYLRPNIKHGEFSDEEDRIIFNLFITIGSRWSIIAAQLPGRTDNDIKNYWNTKLKKKLMGILPNSQRKPPPPSPPTPPLLFPSSAFQCFPQQQQPSLLSPSPSLYRDYSYNSHPSCSNPFAFTDSSTTSSSVTTVNSVFHAGYEPFPVKDQNFLDFGGYPRCSDHQHIMMIKQEEVEFRGSQIQYGFDFDHDGNNQRVVSLSPSYLHDNTTRTDGASISRWAEKINDYFGENAIDYDFSSSTGTAFIDDDNKLVANGVKGLYYF